MTGQPRTVILLTADAFGVLPPIARLTHEQAAYHFISGYTAKLAGTEVGVKEPSATFSACFGAPFMPRHPGEYATMLTDRLAAHDATVWLVNTGWTGGPYGTGERMNINHTRAMVRAALAGRLADMPTRLDPIFRLEVPLAVHDVPSEFLDPRSTWPDAVAYDRTARRLAAMFAKNFDAYADGVDAAIRDAGPLTTPEDVAAVSGPIEASNAG
jgi:phosphoenolpyruvate carboxykinase (ATP)